MKHDDMLRSLGDRVTAIDRKLESLLDRRDGGGEEQIKDIKSFFDALAEIVSTKFIGDLPGAIESLEKKIGDFDLDIADALERFSGDMISYENRLEERLEDEIKALGEQFESRLEHHQKNQTEQLTRISHGLESLGAAIGGLAGSLGKLDMADLNRTMENIEQLLKKRQTEPEPRKGFFKRK